MRIVRFRGPDGDVSHGILRGDSVSIVRGDILGSWEETGAALPLADVQLLAPTVPVNMLCIGRNYREHVAESGGDASAEPLLFLKATSCVVGPDAPIVLPRVAPAQVDYEAELAAVIGTAARGVPPEEALGCVLGYTCANDVSARDCQARDGQWARAKSFDTFGPLGPWIETDLEPSDLRIQGRLNGNVVQDARTSEMIFGVARLISYLSQGMTLVPGTVLLTGTPAGCGFARTPPVWLRPGDVYEVEIEGIGVLRNPVAAEG